MLPNRENVFQVLARLEQANSLPDDGITSVFVTEQKGNIRTHAVQLAVKVQADNVYVRFTRLPFVRPYVFSRQALRIAKV
ncbi:MAG: hypothetical protein IJ381_01160 [Clostridia bacterium]|nr:hypothetical protein [Clostridia bacterium]